MLEQILTHLFPKHRAGLALFLMCALALIVWMPHATGASPTFLEANQAFSLTVEHAVQGSDGVQLHWEIAPGYYLYRDRIKVTAAPEHGLGPVSLPRGYKKEDPSFGVVEIYHDSLTLPVHVKAAKELTVTWQGCAEAGLCYPPQTRKIPLSVKTNADGMALFAPTASTTATQTLFDAANTSDSRITELLSEHSLAWTIPVFFLLGIALAFTPCVLPMVPIISSIVVGNQASPRRAFTLSLAFVLPMALTYALLGAIVAMGGANVQALLQNKWALTAFGGVFIALALAMFDLITLQLPAFLNDRLNGMSQQVQGGTLTGAALLGLLSALLVGPCMTAPLAGTLLYIAQTGKVLSGALLLFALGLGMGLPQLIISTVGARYLPKPGLWMKRVKGAFGFLLLGMAVWILQRVVSAPVTLALWAALLIGLAATLMHLATQVSRGRCVLVGFIALVFGLCGYAMGWSAVTGKRYTWQALSTAANPISGVLSNAVSMPFDTINSPQMLQAHLELARQKGQPVLVDFYADWCVSCHSIDREVFTDPQVRQALEGVQLLRVDVTVNDPKLRALMLDYQVQGPPTVMFFDAQGHERRDTRLVGEFGTKILLQQLHAILSAQVTQP